MTDASHDRWTESGPVVTQVGTSLVVTLPRELSDATLAALRSQVMERLQRGRMRELVFEASGLDVIDAAEFRALAAVARGASWLGVRPLLVGLSAGIVRYLVDVGADASDFDTFRTLDDALVAIARGAPGGAHAEPAEHDDGPPGGSA
jgi:anti-anti-sigma regulatory factor